MRIMTKGAESVLVLVKNGRPITEAILEIYGDDKPYYREVSTVERKVVRLARFEYQITQRQQMGKKKSSGIYVSMTDDLRIKINELALISNSDTNALIRSLIKQACKDAGI